MKKKVWKLTPETRARMAAAQRLRFAKQNGTARKHTERNNGSGTAATELDEAIFAYALGHIESWIGTYAASAGVPANALASRVGKVLHSKTRG